MPKELFEKYAAEYQGKIYDSTQELMRLRAQSQQKERERKLTELTSSELAPLTTNKCYKTVGKMFIEEDLGQVKGELANKCETLKKELDAIQKVALKIDSDIKDYERNLKSLINSVQG